MKTDARLRLTALGLLVALILSACGIGSEEWHNPVLDLLSLPSDSTRSVLVSSTQAVPVEPALDAGLPDGLTPSEQILVTLYETVNPSVVNINVVKYVQTFGPRGYRGTYSVPVEGQGSGFVYDLDGHIVTNNHVVSGADSIVVTFSDGTQAEATLVGGNAGLDLAVIHVDVEATRLVPVIVGDSDGLRVGQSVVALGAPFGLQNSMSTGIVSGLNRTLETSDYVISGMVQTDAAINPGNSGGPLLNLSGELIGVNTAIESDIGESSGVGYALPSSYLKTAIPMLIQEGAD